MAEMGPSVLIWESHGATFHISRLKMKKRGYLMRGVALLSLSARAEANKKADAFFEAMSGENWDFFWEVLGPMLARRTQIQYEGSELLPLAPLYEKYFETDSPLNSAWLPYINAAVEHSIEPFLSSMSEGAPRGEAPTLSNQKDSPTSSG